MNHARCFIALFTLVILAAAPAAAQPQKAMMPDVPRLFGQFTPQKGVWAQYDVLDKETMKTSKISGAPSDAFFALSFAFFTSFLFLSRALCVL